MTVNLKRVFNPLICAAAGLFNFIFMFFNYAVVFFSAFGEGESVGRSAYQSMSFGDESLANGMDMILSNLGKDANLTFLLVFVSLLLIFMAVLSAGLLFAGIVGLLREFANVNILGSVAPGVVMKLSKKVLKANLWTNIISAILLGVCCLVNFYSGSIFGQKISLGMRPGFGMILLFVLSIVAWKMLLKYEKKFFAPNTANTSNTVYVCSACGEKFNAADKFCNKCGAPVVAVETAPAKENGEASADVSDAGEANEMVNVNMSSIAAFFKGLWAKIKKFFKEFDWSKVVNFFNNISNKINAFAKKNNIPPIAIYIAGGVVLFVVVLLIVLAANA